MDKLYSLNEIAIIPSDHPTKLEHRSQTNPYDKDNKLPIFVAPMTSIINESNFNTFNSSRVTAILPRNIKYEVDGWKAVSLDEFNLLINSEDLSNKKILIDVANGHMSKILDLAYQAKLIFPDLMLMAGNIANPKMLKYYEEAGIDYCRVGIGGGSVCSTSVLTGIHYSLPVLLSECFKLKQLENYKINVIADGGINTIDKAIKCLALGADYVMMGKLFAQCYEACGKIIEGNKREYYGMASNKGQVAISGGIYKQPEGVEMTVDIKYTLEDFLNKFEAALRSAMTYTDSADLYQFRRCTTAIQSIDEFRSYYKDE